MFLVGLDVLSWIVTLDSGCIWGFSVRLVKSSGAAVRLMGGTLLVKHRYHNHTCHSFSCATSFLPVLANVCYHYRHPPTLQHRKTHDGTHPPAATWLVGTLVRNFHGKHAQLVSQYRSDAGNPARRA